MPTVSIRSLIEGHAAAPAKAESVQRPLASQNQPAPLPRQSNFDLSRDELVNAVEAGCLQPANAFGDVATWPTSAISGRAYHGANVLTLAQRAAERGYESGAWCTFDAAKSRGWSVRKGEQHTKVFFFAMAARDTGEVDPETGDPVMESYPKLVHHKVFNVAQLDVSGGDPVARPIAASLPRSREPSDAAVHTLERIADGMGLEVLHDATLRAPVVADDAITLPNPPGARDPQSVSDLARALLQVAVSETAKRPKDASRLSTEQIEAETALRASMAQAMLSMKLGFPIKGGEAFVPDQMATAFSGGKNVGMRSAKAAEQAVTYLLSFDPELHDDLVSEAKSVHDEILDAGGDPVVFDGSQIDFSYVTERSGHKPRA
ncbi:ArdC-like ssDNA-binding domain-containing protein [Xanthomonas euvesicatoria]